MSTVSDGVLPARTTGRPRGGGVRRHRTERGGGGGHAGSSRWPWQPGDVLLAAGLIPGSGASPP
ncbi:hypothetical protein [Nonomuraea rubra]|uniref:hypothetical protein n=1 Tax=Nonomuraea rubra TaxID=46180 RepID=UPI0031E7A213